MSRFLPEVLPQLAAVRKAEAEQRQNAPLPLSTAPSVRPIIKEATHEYSKQDFFNDVRSSVFLSHPPSVSFTTAPAMDCLN